MHTQKQHAHSHKHAHTNTARILTHKRTHPNSTHSHTQAHSHTRAATHKHEHAHLHTQTQARTLTHTFCIRLVSPLDRSPWWLVWMPLGSRCWSQAGPPAPAQQALAERCALLAGGGAQASCRRWVCSNYCSGRISLKIRENHFSYFLLLFQNYGSYSSSLALPYKSQNNLACAYRNLAGILRSIVLDLLNGLGRIFIYITLSLPTWTRHGSSLIESFFDFFHRYLIILTIQVCVSFTRFRPKYLGECL